MQWLMSDNRAQVMLALQHDPTGKFAKLHDHPVAKHLDQMTKNRDEITALVAEFSSRTRSAEDQKLFEVYTTARTRYVTEGLNPAREAILANDFDRATRILLDKINPLFAEATATANAYTHYISEEGKGDYEDGLRDYALERNMIIGIGFAALALMAVIGTLITRGITLPLRRSVSMANAIARASSTMRSRATGATKCQTC